MVQQSYPAGKKRSKRPLLLHSRGQQANAEVCVLLKAVTTASHRHRWVKRPAIFIWPLLITCPYRPPLLPTLQSPRREHLHNITTFFIYNFKSFFLNLNIWVKSATTAILKMPSVFFTSFCYPGGPSPNFLLSVIYSFKYLTKWDKFTKFTARELPSAFGDTDKIKQDLPNVPWRHLVLFLSNNAQNVPM